MAAKKTTPKSAPTKVKAKPASKPSKPASKPSKPAAKPTKPAAKPTKPAAKPTKPAAKPTKPAAKPTKPAAKPTKPVPAVAPEKPAQTPKIAKPEAKQAKPVDKQKPVEKIDVEPKVVVIEKKPVVKSRSSVVDFPAPPAPVKPPFVPPKPVSPVTGGQVAAGSNGTHSPAFVQKQRQRLLDLRDDLVDAVSGMARDTIRNAPEGSEASGSGQHQGDAGSDAYDRDFALSVLAKEQDALYEIEQALRRIQSGSYGICEISSRKIPQTRLEAIPFARLTVECQAQWEKEYGNRRFRPSNEVGFSGGKYAEDEDSESVSLDEDED